MSRRTRRVFEFAVADATPSQSAHLFPLLTSACGHYHTYVATGKEPSTRGASACIMQHDRLRRGRVPFTTCFTANRRLALIVKTDRTDREGALYTSMCMVVLDPETGKFRRDGSVYRSLAGPKHCTTCWNGECAATSSHMSRCERCGVARYCGPACEAAHRKDHEPMCNMLA